MLSKFSSKEENTILSLQLYQLQKEVCNNTFLIEMVGDLLPGVVLINNMIDLKNTYMNAAGCSFLDKTRKEISDMGAAYFTSESFCQEEMALITNQFTRFALRNDEEEVTGFYQKVRRDINAPWTQFYLSGKLLKGCHGSFIFMGNEVGDRKNGICQANQLLNTESISLVTFQRFNSLSKREKEILKLMAEGYQNKEIADRLSIAPFTVQTHRKNIKAKLEIKNMRELIRVSDLFNW